MFVFFLFNMSGHGGHLGLVRISMSWILFAKTNGLEWIFTVRRLEVDVHCLRGAFKDPEPLNHQSWG